MARLALMLLVGTAYDKLVVPKRAAIAFAQTVCPFHSGGDSPSMCIRGLPGLAG